MYPSCEPKLFSNIAKNKISVFLRISNLQLVSSNLKPENPNMQVEESNSRSTHKIFEISWKQNILTKSAANRTYLYDPHTEVGVPLGFQKWPPDSFFCIFQRPLISEYENNHLIWNLTTKHFLKGLCGFHVSRPYMVVRNHFRNDWRNRALPAHTARYAKRQRIRTSFSY